MFSRRGERVEQKESQRSWSGKDRKEEEKIVGERKKKKRNDKRECIK